MQNRELYSEFHENNLQLSDDEVFCLNGKRRRFRHFENENLNKSSPAAATTSESIGIEGDETTHDLYHDLSIDYVPPPVPAEQSTTDDDDDDDGDCKLSPLDMKHGVHFLL